MIDMVLAAAGVIAPAIVIALAVRRWFDRVPWWVAGLCLALSLAVVGRGVFTSDMPVPLDEVVRGYPYRGLFGEVTAQNDLTNDTVKQILPWMHTVREQMLSGRAPLWNPHLFSGYPLLGNGQSAPFSPVFLLTLFVTLPKQMVAMAGVKLFIALLFGYLFIKREGVSDAAAFFGSVVFALAIFNNVFLYYPMTAVTLLLPAAAYAVLLALRTTRAAPLVLVAIVVASLLAGGHPESVVHVALAVVLLVGIEWLAPRWGEQRFGWRDFVRVTMAAVLGLLIAAPAWVPVVEQALISVRVDSLRTTAAAPVFPVTAVWAMLNPDGFGNPARQNWSWIFSYTHVASLYLGLIVTALIPAAVFSPRATRRERLLIVASAVLFLAAMRWSFVADVFYGAPPLSWVAHDRLRFVICFFVAIAVSATVHRFRRSDVLLTLGAALALTPAAVYVLRVMDQRGLFRPELAIGVAALVVFAIAAAIQPRRAAPLALALTAVELFVFNLPYNAMVDGRYYAPRLPIVDALKEDARGFHEPFRVLGLDWVFLPNAAAQYGLEDVRGSDPMAWADYGRFFRKAAVKDAWIEDVKRIADASHPVIDFLNVRYLLTEPGMEPGAQWELIYNGVDGGLYRNREYQSRFFIPRVLRRGGTPVVNPAAAVGVRRWSVTAYRLRVVAADAAVVASSHPAMPWWTVEVNGERARPLRINEAFLGFAVPAGTSEVVVRYLPWSYWVAVTVALAATVALGWWVGHLPKSLE